MMLNGWLKNTTDMETNFDFKSQISTTREQSERLLALGLKKETADCCYYYYDGEYLIAFAEDAKYPSDIPAWSLGRLLELIKHSDICNYNDFGCIKLYIDLDDFETCITMISYMVKEGYFNKEYLEEE